MKQVFQNPSSKEIEVVEIPEPALRPGTLLVRNAFSVISPGTERGTVAALKDSYLKTARARPDLVRRVVDTVRREGILAAYGKVKSKLAEPRPLGYSSAGVVVAVGERSGDHFRVGDRVACCGYGVASHAETVCVPVNLAARVPDGVALDHAAFSTLGAIALHGVRQANPTLGERFAVIGLGILGQLAVQLLRAHGCRVAAFDLAEDLVGLARSLGAETGSAGGTDDQVATMLAWTEGVGADGVLVTASSTSDAPMLAAAGMARDRARVVAVGFVPFALPREIAYAKELDLRISRSYGPGRYDPEFEEKGVDYPVGYVRWTETRNLEAFLHAVGDGRLSLAPLISHRFPVERARAAYELLTEGGGGRTLGMILEYAGAPPAPLPPPSPAVPALPVAGEVGVAFVGAGAFARGTLLPIFRGTAGLALRHIVTAHGLTAEDARARYGFERAGTDAAAAIADPGVRLVVVATRHDLHAHLAAEALAAGKHVFVEKPLAITEEQLAEVERAAVASSGRLLVGFNRRFSAMARAVRDALSDRGPLLMQYRVNAGRVPAGHWSLDPEIGGGRIVGEGCHFIDLMSFLAGDPGIVSVRADSAGRPRGLAEDVVVQVGFADGSVGQLLYTASGGSALGKERIEAHAGGVSAEIDDFRACRIHAGAKSTSVRGTGKGHAQEVAAFVEAVVRGGDPPIALATLLAVTRATFEVHRSLAGPTRG